MGMKREEGERGKEKRLDSLIKEEGTLAEFLEFLL